MHPSEVSVTLRPAYQQTPKSREADAKRLARAFTRDALAVLVRAMRNKEVSWSIRIDAATRILDRGWGRPHQSVNVSGNMVHMSHEQALQLLERRASGDLGAGTIIEGALASELPGILPDVPGDPEQERLAGPVSVEHGADAPASEAGRTA